ncbi:MAG: hypothetical protein IOC94_06940 [Methylocystis sp.]|nr:hypothetical protein [Methylocystis sp.]
MSGVLRALAPLVLCIAAWLVSAPFAIAQMRFTAVPIPDPACGDRCPLVIQAEGRITREAARDFVAFAKQVSDQGRLINIVLIHSPGGSVVGSMMLGEMFRTLGTTVVVARVNRGGGVFSGPTVDSRTGRTIPPGALTNATCNSACVYAVMGGRKRIIPNDSRMGVHRMQSEESFGFDPVSNRAVSYRRTGSENEVSALKRYTKYMGVDPRLIDLAESVPHEDIRVLSTEQIRGFRLGRSKL